MSNDKRKRTVWYGPVLNAPGHKNHGARPMVCKTSGKMLGWLMPPLAVSTKTARQQREVKEMLERIVVMDLVGDTLSRVRL